MNTCVQYNHAIRICIALLRRHDIVYSKVFKMFKGFDNIMLNDFFKLSTTTLRGHTLKIYKPQVHMDVRKFIFTVRIMDIWNSLPISLIVKQ